MASIDNRPLKAYVRFDGTGRIVPSSRILRRKKPKVGKWVEIPAYECCNPVPPIQCVEYVLELGEVTSTLSYTDCTGALVEQLYEGPDTIYFCAQYNTATATEGLPYVYGDCTGNTSTTTSTSTTVAPTTTTTTTAPR